jgi:hypothetical protein
VHKEIVAVALQIVADEFEIIPVGDVADSLGQERIIGLDFLKPNRPLLRAISAMRASSSTRSRAVNRLIVKANFAPSGTP